MMRVTGVAAIVVVLAVSCSDGDTATRPTPSTSTSTSTSTTVTEQVVADPADEAQTVVTTLHRLHEYRKVHLNSCLLLGHRTSDAPSDRCDVPFDGDTDLDAVGLPSLLDHLDEQLPGELPEALEETRAGLIEVAEAREAFAPCTDLATEGCEEHGRDLLLALQRVDATRDAWWALL